MAKGRRRRKATLHSAGKVVENDLLDRARELADDPSLAVPECVGRCGWFCPFCSARKRIQRIHDLQGDEKALERYAKGGHRLARAYAATVLLAKQGKIPYVAELRLPTGNVPYTIRGAAFPFELAGLQHYDDRALRLLSVRHFVKNRGLHVYSTEDGLVNTGRRPAPPADFVSGELKRVGLSRADGERWTCPHGGTDAGDAIVIEWVSAQATGEWCHQCAGDANTLLSLVRHIAAPNARADFRPRVHLAPLEGEGAPEVDVGAEDAPAYAKAAFGDAAFIERARESRADQLRARGGRAFVLGTRWFGGDADAFIAALDPTDVERRALEAALADVDRPVVASRKSATRVLHDVWADRGRVALKAAASGSVTTADALYDPDASPDAIGDALNRAASRGAAAVVDAALPRFKRLPEPARVADAIARAYRAHGEAEGKRVAHQKVNETRERGVPLAFLRALGEKSGHAWKFSGVDEGMAEALAEDAKALLTCDAKDYAQHLDALARKAGSPDGVQVA